MTRDVSHLTLSSHIGNLDTSIFDHLLNENDNTADIMTALPTLAIAHHALELVNFETDVADVTFKYVSALHVP